MPSRTSLNYNRGRGLTGIQLRILSLFPQSILPLKHTHKTLGMFSLAHRKNLRWWVPPSCTLHWKATWTSNCHKQNTLNTNHSFRIKLFCILLTFALPTSPSSHTSPCQTGQVHDPGVGNGPTNLWLQRHASNWQVIYFFSIKPTERQTRQAGRDAITVVCIRTSDVS